MKLTTQIQLNPNARLLLGEGLFETMAVKQGMLQHGKAHWQRIQKSAMKLNITFDISCDHWINEIQGWIEANAPACLGVKVLLLSGQAKRGLVKKSDEAYWMIQPIDDIPEHTPLKLMKAPWPRVSGNPLHQMKTMGYLEAVVAKKQALEKGFDDVIFFDEHENLAETTTGNVFVLKDDQILTPTLKGPVLPGITRERVIECCQQHHIPCKETFVSLEDVTKAQGMFVTNTLMGLRPVFQFESTMFDPAHALVGKINRLFDNQAV